MKKREKLTEPWNDESAQAWLGSLQSWRKMTSLIEATLKLEARQYPHEIRAAASLVIMLCRKNLWPTKEDEARELDDIVAMARRQMSVIKSLFAQQVKFKPELASDASYRKLLSSMDEEMRILEARMSDSEAKRPQEPPSTWGNFWSD